MADEDKTTRASGGGADEQLVLRHSGTGNLLRYVGQEGLLRQRSRSAHVRMPVAAGVETARPEPATAEQLWGELHARLRGFVRARISDPEMADDVAQEVLLRLHRGLAALRADDRLDAFAYVRAGEVFGLLGPNGAGKSTTMGMLGTLVRPTGGRLAADASLPYRARAGWAPHTRLVPRSSSAR